MSVNSDTSESEYDESDEELQEAFAAGLLKPGLNTVEDAPKVFINNLPELRRKLNSIKQTLPWLELLECVNKQAPLAPELAAQMQEQEERRQNQLKNNRKLPQVAPAEDPVLNDFKREMLFHRQAQAAVLDAIPKLKSLGFKTKRPDDYFAEMAKTDAHMQKVREKLMKKQVEQQRSERVKQLRAQRKEGKAMQSQARVKRQQEKKEMLDQVKRVRKGVSKDLSFLDGKKPQQNKSGLSKRAMERRNLKNKKFGFGGKKKGSKLNTKSSSADMSDYKRPKPTAGGKRTNRTAGKGGKVQQRMGKNKRMQNKNKPRR